MQPQHPILTHPYVRAEVRLHGSSERSGRGSGGLQVRCPQQHAAGAAVVLCSAHQRLCHHPHRLLVARLGDWAQGAEGYSQKP